VKAFTTGFIVLTGTAAIAQSRIEEAVPIGTLLIGLTTFPVAARTHDDLLGDTSVTGVWARSAYLTGETHPTIADTRSVATLSPITRIGTEG